MVEKRTLVFLTLAMLVWAGLASAFAGYNFLQNTISSKQLNNAQNLLSKLASNYSEDTNQYDALIGEYGSIYGDYLYSTNSDYDSLMPLLGNLIASFGGNYSNLFTQEDINKTYNQLRSDFETLLNEGNVSRTDFYGLLNEYYNLFMLSALKEQQLSVSDATTLSVSFEINYGNGTVDWHNYTDVPAGSTLFILTQESAVIGYKYYASNEPGHVLVDSINNLTTFTDSSFTWGYSWIWYRWNSSEKKWVSGSVGCDAWFLEDSSVYRWNYERWSYP